MEPENNEKELVFEMITFSKKNHKSLPANLCISTSEFGFDDPKIKSSRTLMKKSIWNMHSL